MYLPLKYPSIRVCEYRIASFINVSIDFDLHDCRLSSQSSWFAEPVFYVINRAVHLYPPCNPDDFACAVEASSAKPFDSPVVKATA